MAKSVSCALQHMAGRGVVDESTSAGDITVTFGQQLVAE
jgi:hypothetical protein